MAKVIEFILINRIDEAVLLKVGNLEILYKTLFFFYI